MLNMEGNTTSEINKRGKRERDREGEEQTWIKRSKEEIVQRSSIQPRTNIPNLA